MNRHVDKTNKSQTRVATSAVSQQKSSNSSAFAFDDNRSSSVAQHESKQHESMRQLKSNDTGLPDNLKSGMENLSGMSLDHVIVHYNSPKPAAVQAHAYAQGSEIHLASGQEKHLPHELGHVVQQAQGRVKPTASVGGMAVNDNAGLENEATVMGDKALQLATKSASTNA